MPPANIVLLRRIGAAFTGEDRESMFELLAPDFVLEDRGVAEHPVRHGPEALLANVQAIRDAVPDVGYEAVEIREVDDERIAVRMAAGGTARWSNLRLDTELGQVWTFRDGRAVRLDIYRSWGDALEALGLSG